MNTDLTLSETLPLVFLSFFFLYQTNVPSLYSSTNTFCHDSPIKPSAEQQYITYWVNLLTSVSSLQLHSFNGLFSRTTWVSQHQKGRTILDLLQKEIMSGSGISSAICKSAPHPRQITMPAPHHSVFTGRMPFLLPNQQRQSTDGNINKSNLCRKV